ncbi:hypothetical protein ABIE09_000449 [Lysobacter enzymogenes]|uniref:hypothetical protein n=1 Tax=Lysobacter enzymogenes TaxID=69 RepID=UPI0033992D93
MTADARHWNHVLIGAWERLHRFGANERALGLLQAVWPQPDPAQWSRASLGQRDACLFALHEALFGGRLQTTAACPACGERLESQLRVADLCGEPPRELPQPPAPQRLEYRDYRIEYRLPDSDDLRHLPPARGGEDALDAAVAALLRRCVLSAQRRGRELDADAPLPPALVERLCERMAQDDPLADLQLAVQCPACAHQWSAAFDIGAYLWEELDDWVQDLLSQVHALARHYAWSERDILDLSPVRRRFYLDLVQA